MNKTKSMILLMLSAVLITTASALVSSGDHHVVTRHDEVAPPGVVMPPKVNATTSAGQNESQESIEVEVVMATADGFEPAVVTRPHGPFILAVHNRSGSGELVLRLVSVQDGRRYDARLQHDRRRHYQRLDLPHGEYILSEAGHPAWRCQIMLTQ